MTKRRAKTAEFYRRRVDRGNTYRNPLHGVSLARLRGSAREYAQEFGKFSLDLLNRMKNGQELKGKVIFLGQGMRPLYETVKEINRALKIVPDNRIRYFIFSSAHRGKPHYSRGEAADALIKARIIDSHARNYVIVDYDGLGHIDSFIRELRAAFAKRTGNNEVNLDVLNFDAENRGSPGIHSPLAIDFSEMVMRPVRARKTQRKGVTVVIPSRLERKPFAAFQYLILQEAIKEEVERIAQEAKRKGH